MLPCLHSQGRKGFGGHCRLGPSKFYDEVLLLRDSIEWNSSQRFRSMDWSALMCAFIEPTDKQKDRTIWAMLSVSRWRFKHGKHDAEWGCLEGV